MATINDIGIPRTGINGILQPHYRNRWRIEFFTPGNQGRSFTSMAISAERPKVEYEEVQLDRYNSRVFLQGKYTFQPINVVLEPDIGGTVHQFILQQAERQQRLIGPDSGAFLGQAISGNSYKFAANLEQLDGDHDGDGGQPLETWKLEGCAINNFDFGDLDYQASETVKTSLQIRYDHAYLVVTGQYDKATGGANAS